MFKVIYAALAAASLVCAPMASAQTILATPTIQQETTLSLRGEGRIEMKPDFATIQVGVSIARQTAVDAMQDQAKKMGAIVPALKIAGISDRDMQTSRLSLNPTYNYTRQNGEPPEIVGYNASNVLRVKVRNLDKLGAILDVLVSAGANNINSISFGLEDVSGPRQRARGGCERRHVEGE